tara:strand:- start:5262 stop:6494 length:1233 start_codon:yes stop_codon:yes gene_type:complete
MMLSSLENKIKYFLLGLIFVYNIRFIGAINSGEIISSIYVLFNLRKISLSNELKILIKVSLFYVLLIAISDIYNSNSLYNSLKGAFTPIVILVTIIFLINFFTNKRKEFIIFLIGCIFSQTFNIILFSDLLIEPENPWKWGLGLNVFFLVYLFELFNEKKFSYLKIIILNVTFIIISLFFASRAITIIILLSTFFYFIANLNRNILKSFVFKSTFFLFPILIFSLILSLSLTTNLTSKFLVFEDLNQKNQMQVSDDINIIFSARPEYLIYTTVFAEKPFLGHGSYPNDINFFYRNLLNNYRYDNYLTTNLPVQKYYNDANKEIPTHSYIFESLISHGVLSLIYWLFFTYFIVSIYARNSASMNFFFHVKIITFCYSLFFSPLAYGERLNIELLMCLLFIFYLERNNKSEF